MSLNNTKLQILVVKNVTYPVCKLIVFLGQMLNVRILGISKSNGEINTIKQSLRRRKLATNTFDPVLNSCIKSGIDISKSDG